MPCRLRFETPPERPTRLFRDNPQHPSLQFKKVHDREAHLLNSRDARIPRRRIGRGREITWFWIGAHDDYDGLLKNL